MATVEKQKPAWETEEPRNGASLPIRLMVLGSLFKYIELIAQREKNLQRIGKIKGAVTELTLAYTECSLDVEPEATELLLRTGNLQAAHTITGRRDEKLRLAQAQYDTQIFPVGITSESAAESAPTYKLTVGENGELLTHALDPKTLQPIPKD